MPAKIPFINPVFPTPEELAEDIRQITKNNYYSNNGPFYYRFKESIEAYLGQGMAAAVVANATQGLILSMKLLMIPGRKYVLVPSFTFSAGPLAILWAGFEPYFFDINRHDAQPKLTQIAALLKKEQ